VRVCIVALNALPAIDPSIHGPIGGIETRSWTFARGLALRGEDVQFVVRHTHPLNRTEIEKVRLAAMIDRLYPVREAVGMRLERLAGFPWLRLRSWSRDLLWQVPALVVDRLLHPDRSSLLAPDPWLIELAADVYCTFGVQTHSAKVIASARAARRPSVLFLGSDGDLDPLFGAGGDARNAYGTPGSVGAAILRQSTAIISQTPEQQQLLRDRFCRDSIVLRNPIDIAEWNAWRNQSPPRELTAGLERYVLWVGRAEEAHKRPGLCLDVAVRCPEVQFLMILNRRDPAVEADIRSRSPSNVRIVERIPFPQMPAVVARGAALLSTSRLEGFPNVFLQAAALGVPIVSLEVGAEFLDASRAGIATSGSLDRVAELVQLAWSRDLSAEFSPAAAREYVEKHHGREAQCEALAKLLGEIVAHGA
jgi:glycosyltransferase involved in cell wall biosynthesis